MEVKAVELGRLFDEYGALLTDRQRDCFDLHYNDDLSLGEIAAELGISRQGVRDNLVRTEAALRGFEERMGHLARLERYERCGRRIAGLAGELMRVLPEGDARNSAAAILAAAEELENTDGI